MLVADRVVHHELGLVYLDRYHRLEQQVAGDLAARVALAPPVVADDVLASTLARVSGEHFNDRQRGPSSMLLVMRRP